MSDKRHSVKSIFFGPIVILGLTAAYLAVGWSSPQSVGYWRDDGIYVSNARALAEGHGYRRVAMPEAPLETQKPIAYPAALSLAFRLVPSFPENLPLLLFSGALGAACAVVLAGFYWRSMWETPAREVWMVGMLAAASPVFVAFVRYTMSDLFYAGIAIAALVCADCLARGSLRRERGFVALAALLAAAAVLSRGIGVSLAAAVVLAPLLRRRFDLAAIALGVVLACLAPWWVWQSGAVAENASLEMHRLLVLELSHAPWLPHDVEEVVRVVLQNIGRLLLGLGYFQLGIPGEFVGRAIIEGGARLVFVHVLFALAMAAVVTGFVASARRRLGALHLYALAYLAITLAYASTPHRFLVPWAPFLLFFLLWGIRSATAFVGGARTGTVAATVVAGLLALAFLIDDAKLLGSTESHYVMRERPAGVDFSELRSLERWVRDFTEESDHIASPWPGGVFLATGRQGYGAWPDKRPYEVNYSPERSFANFYSIPAPSESEFRSRDIRENLLAAYHAANVDYYVAYTGYDDTPHIERLIRDHPAAFRLRFTSPKKTIRVYRVHPSPAEPQENPTP
jgi:hypothetical protein